MYLFVFLVVNIFSIVPFAISSRVISFLSMMFSPLSYSSILAECMVCSSSKIWNFTLMFWSSTLSCASKLVSTAFVSSMVIFTELSFSIANSFPFPSFTFSMVIVCSPISSIPSIVAIYLLSSFFTSYSFPLIVTLLGSKLLLFVLS